MPLANLHQMQAHYTEKSMSDSRKPHCPDLALNCALHAFLTYCNQTQYTTKSLPNDIKQLGISVLQAKEHFILSILNSFEGRLKCFDACDAFGHLRSLINAWPDPKIIKMGHAYVAHLVMCWNELVKKNYSHLCATLPCPRTLNTYRFYSQCHCGACDGKRHYCYCDKYNC